MLQQLFTSRKRTGAANGNLNFDFMAERVKAKYSLQCRRILGGRKLLVYVRTVVTAIFVVTEED